MTELERIKDKANKGIYEVEQGEKKLADDIKKFRVTKRDRYDIYWAAALFLAVFTLCELIGLRFSWSNMVFCIPAFAAVVFAVAVKFRVKGHGGIGRTSLFAAVGCALCTALIAACDWLAMLL